MPEKLSVTYVKPDAIHPYEANPRVNDGAVDAVAKSIREFGFQQPIVVDASGVIVCGHTRWKAAQKLGLEKVPVHVAEESTLDQVCTHRISENGSKIGAGTRESPSNSGEHSF